MSEAIRLSQLRKTFGDKVAVRGLDIVVPRGSLCGFIGPNGAGKTTTIRMIMSIMFPDSGELSVLGHPSALEAKDRIGYLPEERGVYKKMKAGAFLAYMAKLKGRGGSDVAQRVRGWLERVGLADVENKRCEELSKGMQQKLQFVSAVIHEPELLILDEPFSGLDPVNMRLLRDLVLEQHRRGATILFSTHVMVQAEQLCERVFMIHDGAKVLDSTLEEIRRDFDPRSIAFEPFDPRVDVSALEAVRGVERVTVDAGVFDLQLTEGSDPAAAIRELVAAVPASRVELRRPSLEDVFVRIVSESGRAEDPGLLRDGLRAGGGGGAA